MKISKYNNFLIQENFRLILEANLELMPKLVDILKKMESPIAKFILDLKDQDIKTKINLLDIDTKEPGHITYYPQQKIDKKDINDLWVVKNDGDIYSSWTVAAKYFNIPLIDGDFFGDCENGTVGKIINSTPYSSINGGGFGPNIVCHFRTMDGEDIIINLDGLEKQDSIKKYKQSGRAGRVINAILGIVQQNFTPQDVEKFTNEFKYKTSGGYFELVSGDDIKYWYSNRYSTGEGTLGSSCMRYDSCQLFFDIYTENPTVCKLLIFRNSDNTSLIDGRALVWTLLDGRVFMDRVYYTSDHIRDMFVEYAKKNNWLFKKDQNSRDSTPILDPKTNDNYQGYLEVKLEKEKNNYEYFPYMDTLKYWDKNNLLIICNDSSRYRYAMSSTEGGDGSCERCEGLGTVDCYNCEGEGSLRCYDCDGSGEINCSDCEGEGDIECENCEGVGSFECSECGGDGEVDGEKCTHCAGEAKIECDSCGGGGRKKCSNCGNGVVNCDNCGGDGNIECGTCDGNGVCDCPDCN